MKCFPKFDTLSTDNQEKCETSFEDAIAGLIVDEVITCSIDVYEEELYTPSGKPLLDIEDFSDSSKEEIERNQLQKSIIGCLTVETSIFNAIILYCQFDKSNQQGLCIVKAIKEAVKNNKTKYLPVFYLVSDNQTSLMDQMKDGLNTLLCNELELDGKIYDGLMCLKGDEKTTTASIKDYIGSYLCSYLENAPNKKLPPIILGLNNKIQIKKMMDIHDSEVVQRLERNPYSRLRSYWIFDEFDLTYKSLRPTIKPILVDHPKGVLSVLGVTASEDGMCEEFPEWETANLVRIEMNAEKEMNYRGIHHPDAKIHRYKQKGSDTNGGYALRIINENISHFTTSCINPKDNVNYFRKVIILGDVRIASQRTLANQLLELKFHIILQNENNLKLIKSTDKSGMIKWPLRKGKVLRDELFIMFNKHNLWDGPVALIGNKKINRGLGYHYALPSGGKGLIWTDEIMGDIDGDANRVQRVSRLHGVIAHCENYPNELHFWIDERTELTVRNTNAQIKSLHDGYLGFQSLGDRLNYAKQVTPLLRLSRRYKISEVFSTQLLAKEWFRNEKIKHDLSPTYECSSYGLYLANDQTIAVKEGTAGITHFKYRSEFKKIMLLETLKTVDTDFGQGANERARIMPVLHGDVVQFVVIYIEKKDDVPNKQ